MSWLLKLFETYERCAGHEPDGAQKLMPISHTPQQAHLEITLDGLGNFKRAQIVSKVETIIPATEKSANRTMGEAAHPLADKVQYVAKDYPAFGGKKNGYFPGYLKRWRRGALHRVPIRKRRLYSITCARALSSATL